MDAKTTVDAIKQEFLPRGEFPENLHSYLHTFTFP